jgi:ribonucleoside-diphosphate reductase alpha chain
LFRTAWEVPQKAIIELAAARQPYIDQSQSLNLFIASPSIGKLSSMYLHAWRSGLKTTYYLRSRPATRIQQATVSTTDPVVRTSPAGRGSDAGSSLDTDAAAVACSLENPDSCDACQ